MHFVLIGGGFLSGSIAKELVCRGQMVTVFSRGKRPACFDSRVSQLNWISYFERPSRLLLSEYIPGSRVIYLAHINGFSAVGRNTKTRAADANIDFFKDLLITIVDLKPAHFTYISSASVYGEGEYSGALTETGHLNPVNGYGFSKLRAEQLCAEALKVRGLLPLIIRPCSIYGENAEGSVASGVIGKMFECLDSGRVFTVNGNGDSCRDFLHASDFAYALTRLIELDKVGEYNIGGVPYSLMDLVQLFEALTDDDFRYDFGPPNVEEAKVVVLDSRKTFSAIGEFIFSSCEEWIQSRIIDNR